MDEQRTAPIGRPADQTGETSRKLAEVDTTLEHLGRLCTRLEQAEQRFKQMTDECGRVLESVVSVDRLHTITLATLNERLGDWCSIERKLLEESARRIERFERGVEREWTALRRLHEEPITELRDQADKLRVACLDAARQVRDRLDAADHGYLLQTANLERRLAEWSERVLQAATARAMAPGAGEARPQIGAVAPGLVDPWPLDGVAQLHQEMRVRSPAPRPRYVPAIPDAAGDEPAAAASTDVPAPPVEIPEPIKATVQPAAEPISTETASDVEPALSHPLKLRGRWIAWAAAALALAAVGWVLIAFVGRMERRLIELESRAQQAAQQLKTADAAVGNAARAGGMVVERAGTMVEILAAPDLRRWDLRGVGPGQGAYGQVLWSRSRGMALTAVGLPPPAGKVYRVWVLGNTRTTAAGDLAIDGTATARLILPGPLTLPPPGSIAVTLEDGGSEDRPAGPTCLTRLPTS